MSKTRFTIYAVSRDCRTFTSADGIPYAHCHDETAAISRREVIEIEGFARPTRIVERNREYPFVVRRIVWECDETAAMREP